MCSAALTGGVLADGAVVHGQHVVHQLHHADGHVLDLRYHWADRREGVGLQGAWPVVVPRTVTSWTCARQSTRQPAAGVSGRMGVATRRAPLAARARPRS